MTAVIHLQEVSKRFGSQVAMDRISLEVPAGIVFALLGENGAGKTTCIRVMLGLSEPDSGQSEIFGLDSVRQSLQIRSQVG
jgi:ABC-2 type transport system ATP-binding protein